jgi:hypothetical protein
LGRQWTLREEIDATDVAQGAEIASTSQAPAAGQSLRADFCQSRERKKHRRPALFAATFIRRRVFARRVLAVAVFCTIDLTSGLFKHVSAVSDNP